MDKGKKKNNIIGNGKKIFLRQLNKQDANAYCEISYDEEIKKYADFFIALNEEEAIQVIERNNANTSKMYGIFVNNEMVGALIFSTKKRMAEIDYFVGKEYRRNGYISKAIFLIAKSNKKNIDKIYFYVRETNDASNAVMSKINALEIKRFPNLKYLETRGVLILYCLELDTPKKKKKK